MSAGTGVGIVLVLGLWPASLAAASGLVAGTRLVSGVPDASAVRVEGEPTGEVWERAAPISDFVQREPSEGSEPSFQTEARVAYSDTALFIRVQALDPEPDRIVGILTRRDEHSPSDWIRVIIDSFRDRRTAYEFAVNPAGVKQDRYWFNDEASDIGWDAVWDVSVARDASGWTAEFRIPLSQLRFAPDGDGQVGFAVVRHVGRLNETSTWPLLPRSENGYVSRFGTLGGLAVGRPLKRLELMPYVVSRVTLQPAQDGHPFGSRRDPGGTLGADAKLALTSGLTLTGTINPDFGQVEADPAVVNLGAFETFFSERRPFFVEGSGVFRFDTDCNDGRCTGLFYSRRIGRTPQGRASIGEGEHAVAPIQTTILGAAKLTGRVGGFSIGALNAVTSAEDARLSTAAGFGRQTVEPLTSYTVVRATREFANRSSAGFMLTDTSRRLTDELRFLPGTARTGGVDWDWRLGSGSYSLTGYGAASTVAGDEAAIARLQRSAVHGFQRPDADHLTYDPDRTRLSGHSASLSFGKISGERVRFNSYVGVKSPGFEINDLGFLSRADTRAMSNWLQWRHDRPSRYLRSFRVNFNQWQGWNFGGDRIYGGGNVNAHAVFANSWSAGGGFNAQRSSFDDRLTRGGPGGLRNDSWNGWQYLNTDGRRAVMGSYSLFYWADGKGSRSVGLNPGTSFRPTAALVTSLGLGYSRSVQDAQWVERVDRDRPHYVFGRLDQTTVSLTMRLNYTLAPSLSLQFYSQPFISAGDYENFKELVDGRAPRHGDRYAPFDHSGNPAFNFKSLRSTSVLRWEYRPGSTLFVVWQQGRENVEPTGEFRLRENLGDLWRLPSRNTLLVKLSYWLNF
jgi:hypothetical protein